MPSGVCQYAAPTRIEKVLPFIRSHFHVLDQKETLAYALLEREKRKAETRQGRGVFDRRWSNIMFYSF
jgi:hypothetical protein